MAIRSCRRSCYTHSSVGSSDGARLVVVAERACTRATAGRAVGVAGASTLFPIPTLEGGVPDPCPVGVVVGADHAATRRVPTGRGTVFSLEDVVLRSSRHCSLFSRYIGGLDDTDIGLIVFEGGESGDESRNSQFAESQFEGVAVDSFGLRAQTGRLVTVREPVGLHGR